MKYRFEANKNHHHRNLKVKMKNHNYSNLLNNEPLKQVLALNLNTCNKNPITLNSVHPLHHLYNHQPDLIIIIIQSDPLLSPAKRKSNKHKT